MSAFLMVTKEKTRSSELDLVETGNPVTLTSN